ncbi:MAG: hypothetical protein CO092_04260 [Candidatus Aenigmarchaeota archaeon CG_4_9_14_3_um_filter_37_18]|nr:MAG: hypothetical protein AUJ50_03845 [Candidatus Aenigmarchaeota archaeon CG1_02_38_14]PIV68620.1 MAG: hypothetical protein COS07_03520 [Candidatus Aenigmarchaeota archaeon CG01_land_8_20_14_3_00_37_9]PIW40762.1 MAG: hypothetical protein COW21_05480 [Candidatus Aenigmarchaeota archaeon CG15_BIG_FIL_POST_REV_8_21_14_020_37_27]PIY35268.1 MAG: hypothetical protein COZ04_04070 [Candidatus Aenigmarchaeota archaeon CG_4_10_14_3_um_filter_37_21]PJB74613.1 MAG: hypothetical protein CO092_04260 [Can
MGVRGVIRDIISIYFGIQIILLVLHDKVPTKGQLLLYAAFLLFFSIWFLMERIGLFPKL